MSLKKGDKLVRGQELISENGKFSLIIDQNGYLTYYYFKYLFWRYVSVLDRFEMQLDGNFSIYDEKNNALISSNTIGTGDYVALDNFGSLTVYNGLNKRLWYDLSLLSK